MNKNVLKTMLVAIGLATGTIGTWAQSITLSPTEDTYIDWNNPDTNYGTEETLMPGNWQEMWDNATPGLKSTEAKITLLKFNIKNFVGKISNAQISVTATNPNSKTRPIYIGYFDLTNWNETQVTANNSGMNTRSTTSLNIHPFGLSASIPAGKTEVCTFTSSDLVDYLNNNADKEGNVSIIIYGVQQSCMVASRETNNGPTLNIEYSDETLYAASFFEETGLQPNVTVYSDENHENAISENSLTDGKTYYFRATYEGYENYDGFFTVNNENPKISFTMTKKPRFHYSINLVNNSQEIIQTIFTSDDAYEGMTIPYTYPKYITNKDGKVTHICRNSTFSGNITVGNDRKTDIVYDDYNGIAYFTEAENGIDKYNGYIDNEKLSSGRAVRAFSENSSIMEIKEDGYYNITYITFSYNVNQSTSLTLKKNDETLNSTDINWSVNYSNTTGVITVKNIELKIGDVLNLSPSSTNATVDYILIEKTMQNVAIDNTYGVATFTPSVALNFSNAKNIAAYKASVKGTTVNLTKVETVAAGEGVLVRSLDGQATTEDIPVAADVVSTSYGNMFVGTLTDIESLPTNGNGYTNYILYNGSKGLGFYQANNQTVAAGKAYLAVPASSAAKISFFSLDGGTVGIEGIESNEEAKEDVYYTISGQRVAAPTKGLYIKNGKKVIVK